MADMMADCRPSSPLVRPHSPCRRRGQALRVALENVVSTLQLDRGHAHGHTLGKSELDKKCSSCVASTTRSVALVVTVRSRKCATSTKAAR